MSHKPLQAKIFGRLVDPTIVTNGLTFSQWCRLAGCDPQSGRELTEASADWASGYDPKRRPKRIHCTDEEWEQLGPPLEDLRRLGSPPKGGGGARSAAASPSVVHLINVRSLRREPGIRLTYCGRETGRVLAQPIGVKGTLDTNKATCKACLRARYAKR